MFETENEFEDNLVAEALQADDAQVELQEQPIKLSSGVVFTTDELALMDPELKAKLLKVKQADENFARGYNAKVAELKALKAQAAPAAPVASAPAAMPTSAPKAGKELAPHELYLYKKMTEENFVAAKLEAERKYGSQVVAIIGTKLSSKFMEIVNKGMYQFDFMYSFDRAFADLVAQDPEVYNAFHTFKSGKTAEQLAAEAAAKAKAEILLSKESTTTGLPSGGQAVVTPPVAQDKPQGMKAAHSLFREKLKELYKEK